MDTISLFYTILYLNFIFTVHYYSIRIITLLYITVRVYYIILHILIYEYTDITELEYTEVRGNEVTHTIITILVYYTH